jgi:hypothetical protein
MIHGQKGVDVFKYTPASKLERRAMQRPKIQTGKQTGKDRTAQKVGRADNRNADRPFLRKALNYQMGENTGIFMVVDL